ncbi:hypothetical protein [Altererythrobacter aquiaggeris]|uniref:hypothetical protein n=1 Tax=Aestuarierythrobacter aquiaggeris TaxID=1898396 RepID=UPI0030158F9D
MTNSNKTKRAGAILTVLTLACCVPPAKPPAPAPAPPSSARPAQPPAATPLPTPALTSWMDMPATAGDWSYNAVDGGTIANFVTPSGVRQFSLGCMAASRRIILSRHGAQASSDVLMTVRTETADRTVTAQPANDTAAVSAAVPAQDPLIDAMAFSKGRFGIEVPGMATLYLPAWPEVTRVMEDCR